MDVSNEQHQRKLVAGACMVFSPLFGLAAWAIAPALHRDETDALRAIEGASGRATAAIIFNAISIALGVFAVMGVAHLLRERETRLGHVGGALALVGLVGVMLNLGIQAAAVEMAKSGAAANAALYKDVLTGPIGVVGIGAGVVLALGILTLGVALYRAEAAPPVSALFLGVFAVGEVAGFLLFSSPIVIASFVALAAGLCPIGYEILTENDQQWEHTPHFHGYHAVTMS